MNPARKIDVFAFLTSGPTPLKQIYKLRCFITATGERVSWKVFTRGMRRLAKAKYIKIIDCPPNPEYRRQAAVLCDLGAKFLCQNGNYDPADFRITCPKAANTDHELKLTQIVNHIKIGALQNQYVLEQISDDTQIRKRYSAKELKNRYIADLEVFIRFMRNGKNESSGYYIEFDNGLKGRNYWAPKLTSWALHVVVITKDANRNRRVAAYVSGSNLNLCILTLEQFNKLGLIECATVLGKIGKSIYDSDSGAWKKVI